MYQFLKSTLAYCNLFLFSLGPTVHEIEHRASSRDPRSEDHRLTEKHSDNKLVQEWPKFSTKKLNGNLCEFPTLFALLQPFLN